MKILLRQWQVAYRMCPSGSILNDKKTPFISVPNTKRFTAADPFLFTYNGKIYLFAELLDLKSFCGKIGYSVFDGKKFGEWKMVISEDYHLSYPNIFEYNGGIYMVPEANESNEIYVYKATHFPDKWEKTKVLVNDGRYVDTTFLDYGDKHLMFTYNIVPDENKKLYIYEIDENGKAELYIDESVSNDDGSARPGGNFFIKNGKIIRVSQDCDGDYGKAIVFSEIINIDKNGYKEKKTDRISPDEIIINEKKVTGLHTYNANEIMEVIDIHRPDIRTSFSIGRFLRKLGKKWGIH